MKTLSNKLKLLLSAFGILTIIPVKYYNFTEKEIAKSSIFFPIVGSFIGEILFLTYFLSKILSFPHQIISILIIIINLTLTRLLHLDGLIDFFDGFLGGSSKESVLKIMDDPHIGSFGAIIGFLILLTKFSLLNTLNSKNVVFLLFAPVFSRFSVVFLSFISKPAKESGLGYIFAKWVDWKEVMISFLLTLTTIIFVPKVTFLICLAIVLMISLFFKIITQRKIEGITGDILGAQIELIECIIYFLFLYF